jgi:hypothetical protein
MSADKFTGKVQQRMNELRLSPNPKVWVEVERRIREKKKRRVIIFWFLFGGLLLTGSGYFVFNQNDDKKESISINHKPGPVLNKTDNTTIDKTREETKIDDVVVIKRESEKTRQEVVSAEKEKIAQPDRTGHPAKEKQDRKITKVKQAENVDIVTKKRKDIVVTKSSSEIKNDKQSSIIPNDAPSITKQPEITKVNSAGIVELPEEIKEIVKQTKGDIQVTTENDNDNTDTLSKTDVAINEIVRESKKKKYSTRKNKWEIGINGALGSSRLTKGGFLDIGGAKSADMFSSPNSGTGNPPMAPVSYADSIPLKGGYWQLGVYVKRKIGKKIYFSTGLNIAVLTTKQRVGAFIDSVGTINNDLRTQTYGGFYRSGQSATFKNRYYFIQLPMLLHWQINKGEKLPITWDNGFLPSFLISSNAVAYDKISRTFYEDKRLYNDILFVYHTGLSAELFKNSKHPLTTGVFYNYPFSRLQKISPPDYNYLGSFGIKMNWLIKK